MGIRAVPTRYGGPALDRLAEIVGEAKGDDPLIPVTILVPSNSAGVSVRRGLARRSPCGTDRPGVAAVDVLTIHRLAELLGAPRLAADNRRPVTGPVLAAGARQVLAQTPGAALHQVRTHPSTERSFVRLHRALRDVSDEALDQLAGSGERQAEVIGLHRSLTDHLRDRFHDERDLLEAASEALDEPGPLLSRVGTVVLHLPQDVSRACSAFLRRLADEVDLVVVAALSGEPAADRTVLRSLARLGLDLGASPSGPGESDSRPVADGPWPRLDHVATATDADDEVRWVVRRIAALIEAGATADSIAVLHGSDDPYARLIAEHLDSAGIEHHGGTRRTLAETSAGAALLGLVGLAIGGLGRERVLDVLASAPFVDTRGRPLPTMAWERISREAGVVDADDWQPRLALFAEDRRRAADDPDISDARRRRLLSNADIAEDLSGFVADLDRELAELERCSTWDSAVTALQRLVARLLGEDDQRRRLGWPDTEISTAHRIEGLLHRLSTLGEVEGSTELVTVQRTLQTELEAPADRSGPGAGVLIGRLDQAIGVELDHTIVVGLAEGVLPGRRREDSLLTDRDRMPVADELALVGDTTADDLRHLLAASQSARSSTTWTMPRGDLRRSTERVPSRWLLRAVAARTGESVDGAEGLSALSGLDWITEVPSFAAGVARTGGASPPANATEYRLRHLDGLDPPSVATDPLVASDITLSRGIELALGRRSPRFTRFDGALGQGLINPTAEGSVVSATRLESWATCPLNHFFEHHLGVTRVEEPESLLRIAPLDRGNLIHNCLDVFWTEVLARPESERPAPGEPWSETDRARLAEIAHAACEEVERRGQTGRRVFWRADRAEVCSELDRVLTWDSQRRARTGARLEASEFVFGRTPGEALTVDLGDGRSLRFRGAIDRLDVTDEGRIQVIDWKTGNPRYAPAMGDDPTGAGRSLQLALYAEAARAHVGTPDAPVEASLVYTRLTTAAEPKVVSLVADGDVHDRLTGTLRTMVDLMEAGVFPGAAPVPDTTPRRFRTTCPACDPDGLGVADRRAEWERTASDPRLEPFLRLTDPDLAEALHGHLEPTDRDAPGDDSPPANGDAPGNDSPPADGNAPGNDSPPADGNAPGNDSPPADGNAPGDATEASS